MRRFRTTLLAALLLGTAVFWTAEPAMADLADDLIAELRCPSTSYSQPLATASSPEALWMRAFIRSKVAEGWPRQRIVDTLARQYGEGILPAPSKEGFSLAAWVTPIATIFGGAALIGYVLTGWLRDRKWHDAYLNAEMARDIDEADMQRYEAQLVRELEQFE